MTRLSYLQAVKKLLPSSPVCAEIGVYRGDFSKMILDELEPINILLVDTWETGTDEYEDGLKVSYSKHENYINILKTFPVIALPFKGTSIDAAKRFAKYKFDFIYIDADHRYKSVKKDLEMWWELLIDVGYIGGHDYGNEVFTGVKKAVDEFCSDKGLKIVLLSDEGDFVLK